MADENRDALLAVARDIIDRRGYVGLSMKTAAAAAGITPEVAKRYYQNRDALLAAAMKLPSDPLNAIPTLVAPGIEGMGERVVRYSLEVLSDPQTRDDLISLARTGVNAGQATSGLQELLEKAVVDRMAVMIGVPDARMRANLVTSYILGIAMTRYAMRLEPLASASDEEVVRMVAPVVQDLLDPRKPIPGTRPKPAKTASPAAAPPPPPPPPAPSDRAPHSAPDFDPDPMAVKEHARGTAGSGRAPAASPQAAPTRSRSSRARTSSVPPPPGGASRKEPKPRHAAVPKPPQPQSPTPTPADSGDSGETSA